MKKKFKNADDLEQAIAALEQKAALQKKELKESFEVVTESLKPVNLLKSGFRNVFSGDLNIDMLDILLGLGSGFLGRKLLLGNTSGILGKNLGRVVQWGMAGLVSKNAEKIKEKAGEWIDKIFKKNKTGPNHLSVRGRISNQIAD